MSQTIQTGHKNVTCSKSREKTLIQHSKCCIAKVSEVQTWSKPLHDSKRNPETHSVEAASTYAVPNLFLPTLNKILDCRRFRYQNITVYRLKQVESCTLRSQNNSRLCYSYLFLATLNKSVL